MFPKKILDQKQIVSKDIFGLEVSLMFGKQLPHCKLAEIGIAVQIVHKRKKGIFTDALNYQYLWWLGTESNCRHADFQPLNVDLIKFRVF